MQAARQADPRLAGGWPAHLALRFVDDNGITRLRRDAGYGPLYVQKPFYAEPGCTHVYLVHPPGGIVGGDTLSIDIDVATGAHALLTTPAATKVYRVAGTPARVEQRLTVRSGATLEWLPLETIAFNDTALDVRTTIQLEHGARCFAWEVTAFGRPASAAPFVAGDVRQSTTIDTLDGEHRTPLLHERTALTGGSRRQVERWGYAGAGICASAWFAPADRALGAALVAALGADAAALAVTVPDKVLTLRALDDDAERCMQRLQRAWQTLRPLALGRRAVTPRIWTT